MRILPVLLLVTLLAPSIAHAADATPAATPASAEACDELRAYADARKALRQVAVDYWADQIGSDADVALEELFDPSSAMSRDEIIEIAEIFEWLSARMAEIDPPELARPLHMSDSAVIILFGRMIREIAGVGILIGALMYAQIIEEKIAEGEAEIAHLRAICPDHQDIIDEIHASDQ